jgi:large subunit ribosomal protein L3
MGKGILGQKIGMTGLYDEFGNRVSVTVVEAGPCVVVNKKTIEKDRYNAIQIGYENEKAENLKKPVAGVFKKKGIAPSRHTREIRLTSEEAGHYKEGQVISVGDLFKVNEKVDVVGATRGKGFAGVVKRYHFKGNTMTRGTHEYRRHPGSIGMREWPGKVLKGKKLPGHMGAERQTVQNLRIFRIDPKRNLMFLNGAVPGAPGQLLIIKAAAKAAGAGKKSK